jgi:4-amino-4-deoxy-L-arabinose transferase-like glycosyltransferase
MLKSGDYIVPHFNSELRVDKPALLYWLQVLGYRLFGIHEFSARLPSALASLFTLLLCYEMGRSLFGKTTGVLAGLMISTMPLMCGTARFANPDALLQLFIVSMMFFFWQSQQGSALWHVAFGVAGGLAVLAKGPVGVVLPLGAIAIYCWWTRQRGALFRPALLCGVLAGVLVAAPWYVLVGVETKAEFLKRFFLEHNVNRFLEPMESHDGFWLYYPVILIVGMAPWSVFWWLLCWQSLQSFRTRAVTSFTNQYCFLASWIGVVLLFFSLAATKLPNYALPSLIPCALLAAHLLVRWCRGEIQPPMWIMYWSLLGVAGIGLLILLGTLIGSGVWPLDGVRMRTYPGIESMAFLGLVPIFGATVAWLLMWRGRRSAVLWALTLTSVCFAVPLAMWGSACIDRYKAPRALVEQAYMQRMDTPIDIYCYNVSHLPSLNFYARRDITHCANTEDLLSRLRNPTQAYLILPAQEWEILKPQASVGYKELAENYDMLHHESLVVISNR